MMSRKRKIGILLTVCLLTAGVASVYAAAGTNPFDVLGAQFDSVVTDLANMWNSINGLEADVAAIESRMDLHLEIADLRARVAVLESAPPGGGTPGPAGPQGPPGPQGETGPPGSDADCTELEAQIISLYSEFLALENSLITQHLEDIALLQGQIDDLEAAPGLGAPDFDSGWVVSLGPGYGQQVSFSGAIDDHENTFVYVLGAYWNGYEKVIHQMNVGVDTILDTDTYSWNGEGFYWRMFPNMINVQRGDDDLDWEFFRVLVWELPTPP